MPVALGIDPGSRVTGWGLVEADGPRLRLITAGEIHTRPKDPFPARLFHIYDAICEAIHAFRPEQAAVEEVFYARNVQTAIKLGHVRGVALLAAAAHGLGVFEYPPATIKKAVAGYGQATKPQVQMMVKRILNTQVELGPDAADALAAAICHLNHAPRLA